MIDRYRTETTTESKPFVETTRAHTNFSSNGLMTGSWSINSSSKLDTLFTRQAAQYHQDWLAILLSGFESRRHVVVDPKPFGFDFLAITADLLFTGLPKG